MNGRRTRIIVSVAQSLIFLILAIVVLFFGLEAFEDFIPLLIIILAVLLVLFWFRRKSYRKKP